MRTAVAIVVFALLSACHPGEPYVQSASPCRSGPGTRVKLLHFSDYHSHAVPFFSEHQPDQAGIARALGYVKQAKAQDPEVLVLSGGDVWNSGTPAWSDKYYQDCTEWRFWNGLLTAMAFGNHDVDYGWDAFSACREKSAYPVLSGNLVDGARNLLLPARGRPYLVKEVRGVRIGLFALSGPDFSQLVKPQNLPPGAAFTDGMAAARSIVAALREQEKVDAVVFFGHQSRETDFEMARQVPGIDVILGTHSHYKGELQIIPGTRTYFISPFQYLNYLSEVELVFTGGRLSDVSGRLVRMSQELAEDREIAAEVSRLERALEADPRYAARFQVIGAAAVELDASDIDRGESVLGNFVMDIVRTAAPRPVHAAFSTASSFRASIPPGPIRMEDYLTALPYKNKVLALDLLGKEVLALVDLSASKQASDNFAVTSGLRYALHAGTAQRVHIAKDPAAPDAGYEEVVPEKLYTVVTTDFMVNVAAGYKDIFARAAASRDTGAIFNDTVLEFIRRNSPVSARRDGRIGTP